MGLHNHKADIWISIYLSHSRNEDEKLKFYIISFSFCLCNSACPLQSLDHVGHIVSESGDLQYQEPEIISLTFVLFFAITQPLLTCLIMPVHVKVRHPPSILTTVHAHVKPLSLNQPISSQCCPLSVQFSSVAQSCQTLCEPVDCSMPGFLSFTSS